MIFDAADFADHEQVAFFSDQASGLRAIVAIHDSALGPGLGGCRMWPYRSEEDALADALRLSRGMSYKSALARLPFGGAKAVILGDPRQHKTPALLHAFGRVVESFRGRYITGEDVGMSVADLDTIAQVTRYAAGLSSGRFGDPSPYTARGGLRAIEAAVKHRLGGNSLDGLRVGVQGVGSVGRRLCDLLAAAGARLFVSDLDPRPVREVIEAHGATVVEPDEILTHDLDVLAPCALGGVLELRRIGDLRAAVVAGVANNQLGDGAADAELYRRGILYAPDYVANAGGVIAGASELLGEHDPASVEARVDGIADRLYTLFERSKAEKRPTGQVADQMARERLSAARRLISARRR